MPNPSQHSLLGPSGAERWDLDACPGSIRSQKTILEAGDYVEVESAAAAAGTAAHAIAEAHFNHGTPWKRLVADYRGEHKDVVVECAQTFIAGARTIEAELPDPDQWSWETEVQVPTGGPIGEPGMFGTADRAGRHRSKPHISVIDFKSGYHPHFPHGAQCRQYGIGAAHRAGLLGFPDLAIDLYIIQPRRRDGLPAIMHYRMTQPEIGEYIEHMRRSVAATKDLNAPVRPGDWCHFCIAAGSCPVRAAAAIHPFREAVGGAFADASAKLDDGPTREAPISERVLTHLPTPDQLTPQQIGDVMTAASPLIKWLESVKEAGLALAMAGKDVPGWVLTMTVPHRQWDVQITEMERVHRLQALGFDDLDIYTVKPASPAQLEGTAKRRGVDPDDLADLIKRPPGAFVIKPEAEVAEKARAIAPQRVGGDFEASELPSDGV